MEKASETVAAKHPKGRPEKRFLTPFTAYVQAVLITAVAAGLKLVLDRGFGELPAYITFYPAVVICSMLGGVGPGVLAMLLGLLAADLLSSSLLEHWRWPAALMRWACSCSPSSAWPSASSAAAFATRPTPRRGRGLARRGPGQGARQPPGRLRRGQRRHVGHRRGWRCPAGQRHRLPLAGTRRVGDGGNAQPGDIVGCIHALADPAGCGHTPCCASCPIRNTFTSVLRTGKPVYDVEAQACSRWTEKEVRLWLEVSADPLVLDGRRHVILALNNITSRKRAEEALLHTSEELARSNGDLEQFASVVSHDLQEPLRTRHRFRPVAPAEVRRSAGRRGRPVHRFRRRRGQTDGEHDQDLLAYSRVGARGQEPTPTESGEALQRALDNLKTSIQETAAEITHGALPAVRADATQLVPNFSELDRQRLEVSRLDASKNPHQRPT